MRNKPNDEMTYYSPTLTDPHSEKAGVICELVANTAKECGYPACQGKVVGCAVHECTIKTNNGYGNGSQFLPVCAKHKVWEFSKLNQENIAWNLD
jgi:hypothetical protein